MGAGHFSCLDLKSGFWQIRMDEASKQYTTFTVGNLGFFECDRMPFGLCKVPATFQWLMQNCMGELNFVYCLIYLDDLIVFSRTTEEHLHHLHIVFDRLREYNLKLKPSKCSLFKEEINYLAHKVSKAGIQPSNINVKAIAEYAPPKTYIEIRAFLGLVGHYRCDHTLSLLQEHFCWPGMAKQMRQVIKTCRHCLQYEGGTSKAPLCPIVATAPMDLLHIDFTSIETTMELDKSPRIANFLVFQDHFT